MCHFEKNGWKHDFLPKTLHFNDISSQKSKMKIFQKSAWNIFLVPPRLGVGYTNNFFGVVLITLRSGFFLIPYGLISIKTPKLSSSAETKIVSALFCIEAVFIVFIIHLHARKILGPFGVFILHLLKMAANLSYFL